MNNTNIKQIDGGTIIKQGDFASRLSFELLDENKEPIDLEGKEAVVTLNTVYGNEVYLNKALTVSKSSVSFTIDQILPTGSYNIEIKCEGYIFPSDNHAIIKVEKGHDEYVPREPDIKVPTQSDVEKVVDDKINNPEYIEKIKGPQGPQGPQGEKGSDGKDGVDGVQGKSAYQSWLDLGNEGSEEDFINSLKAQSANVKRGPTGYFLDRTTNPWTIVFDNNCSLQLPDYPTTESIYGYGFGNASPFGQDVVEYPITLSILRSSNGSLSIQKWKSNNRGALYWSDSTKVINPINDKEKFDFTNGKYNEKDTNFISLARQKNVIRVMYELGIWSEKDILELGVVEK